MRAPFSVAIAVLLSFIGMPGLVHAGQTIASAPVLSFWLYGQDACYVRNTGAKPVSVNVQIAGEAGIPLAPTFQNCNDAPLAPRTTCVVLVSQPGSGFSACTATASGSARSLRGTMETRLNLEIVDAQDLR